MFGNHGLCGLLEEGAHGKSPKCLGGNLGDFGEFCKGLKLNNANKQKCNGNFVPNEKEFKKEITMKEFQNSPGFNVPMKTPKRKKM